MKQPLLLSLLVAVLFIWNVNAQAPRTLNYQGVLTTDGVTPVTDGNYAITFNLYTVPSGGTSKWTENHASVPVTNGEFAVVLGQITPINLTFDAAHYLGITVSPDPEMTPRVELTASPFAMGLNTTSSIVIGQSANPSIAGELRYNGTNFEGYNGAVWNSLDVAGTPNVYGDGTNVGIGVLAPWAKFHIDSVAHILTDGGSAILTNNLYVDAGTPRYARAGANAAWIELRDNGNLEYSQLNIFI